MKQSFSQNNNFGLIQANQAQRAFQFISNMKLNQPKIKYSLSNPFDSHQIFKSNQIIRPQTPKYLPIEQFKLMKYDQEHNQTLSKLFFHQFGTLNTEKSCILTPDQQTINYDIELKKYISGKKLPKEQSLKSQNLSEKRKHSIKIQNTRNNKQKKQQKSKSQILRKQKSRINNQITIFNFRKPSFNRLKPNQKIKTQVESSFFYNNKQLRPSKTLNYLNKNQYNQSQPKYFNRNQSIKIEPSYFNRNQSNKSQLNLRSIQIKDILLQKMQKKHKVQANVDKINYSKSGSQHEQSKKQILNKKDTKNILRPFLFNKELKRKKTHNDSFVNLIALININSQQKIRELRKMQQEIILIRKKSKNIKNS